MAKFGKPTFDGVRRWPVLGGLSFDLPSLSAGELVDIFGFFPLGADGFACHCFLRTTWLHENVVFILRKSYHVACQSIRH